MLYYLTFGVVLGLSAGLAPGPLLTLVISETLQHDLKAGIKVALAPMVTDLPILLVTFYVFSQFTDVDTVLGIVSLVGCCFVLWLGYQSLFIQKTRQAVNATKPRSLSKGVLANLLSPHPYLF